MSPGTLVRGSAENELSCLQLRRAIAVQGSIHLLGHRLCIEGNLKEFRELAGYIVRVAQDVAVGNPQNSYVGLAGQPCVDFAQVLSNAAAMTA